MKAKVVISFAGATVSGAVGEVINITDPIVLEDLLKAGYVVSLDESTAPAPKKAVDKKKKAKE